MVMQKFLTDEFSEQDANLIAFGVPAGKEKKAVESFRKASWFVEVYDIDKMRNLVENVRPFDIGNVKIEDVGKVRKEIQNKNKVSLMISDAHLPTYYALKNFKGKLIVFDAHSDMYDEYIDEKIVAATNTRNKKVNDTTWLRRLVEENNLEVFIVGLRSVNEDIMKFIEEENIQFATSKQVKNDIEKVKNEIKNFAKNSSLYISLDIDVFDPSIAPGVKYPEPGGILFPNFQNIIEVIDAKIKGIDVCCMKDDDVTNFLAVRSILEILGKIHRALVSCKAFQ